MAAAHPFGAFVGCRFKRIGIAHFARLQETTSKCALTLCHAVLRVLRQLAILAPALRPPASQCAPGLTVGPLREGSVSTVDAKVNDSSSALSFFFFFCLLPLSLSERSQIRSP